MGDHVVVRPADVKPAKKVTLAPAQPNLRISGSGAALVRTFAGRPVAAGDLVSTSVYRRTPGMDRSQFPEEIFQQFFQQRAFGLQEIRLVVTSTSPRGIVQITQETEIELLEQYAEPEEARPMAVTYDDIGGLGDTILQVREMIELPLKHPELFSRLGIDPPKGVLLYGSPGTGKTLLARAVAAEAEAQFYHAAGPEVIGSMYGQSEQRLREIFEEAQKNAPSIIFFDEIDSIAPKRDQVSGETERRVVAQLLTLMDGLEPRQNVVVIAATNRVDALDEALRRPGRFDREIVIGVPDLDGRREILGIHTRGMPLAEGVDLEAIAARAKRYTGADLENLTRRAGLQAIRKNPDATDVEIPMQLFEQALRETRASVTPEAEEEYRRVAERLKQESVRTLRPFGFTVNQEAVGVNV